MVTSYLVVMKIDSEDFRGGEGRAKALLGEEASASCFKFNGHFSNLWT